MSTSMDKSADMRNVEPTYDRSIINSCVVVRHVHADSGRLHLGCKLLG